MSSNITIRVYTPASSVAKPVKLARDLLLDLIAARGLAWQLAIRDLKSQYRQAFFGMLWAVILPLTSTVAWVFLSSAGMISAGKTGLPYPAYVFSGTILWSIFMDALNAPLAQTIAARPMLAKINFPREALIMSGILQTLFNAGIKVVLLLFALVAFGVYPDWHLALFPLALTSLVLMGTTLGLLLTPLGLLYTDIGKGLSLVMQFLMFVTPVLFPIPAAGWAREIFLYNPLTPLIMTCRHWLTGFAAGFHWQFVFINLALCVLLLVAMAIYRVAMPLLIERMGS